MLDQGELMFEVHVPGPPQVWTRTRQVWRRDRGGEQRRTHEHEPAYEQWRRNVLLPALFGRRLQRPLPAPLLAPVRVAVCAVFRRPSRAPSRSIRGQRLRYPWPWTTGRNRSISSHDVDNLAKAVLDGLQYSVPPIRPMLVDDSLVVSLKVSKWYAAVGESPHTEVRVWRMA